MLGNLLWSGWALCLLLLTIIFRRRDLRDFSLFFREGREKETATDTILRFNILENMRNTMLFAPVGDLALRRASVDFDRELVEVVFPVFKRDINPIYSRLRLCSGGLN